MPVPSRVIVSPPSMVSFGFVEPMNMVKVIGMVCGPAPQLNVMVPPAANIAVSAASVQEDGVPFPTTPAVAAVERNTATAVRTNRRTTG